MELKTTECDKLGEESRAIFQFLEWLSSTGLGLGEHRDIIHERDLYEDGQSPYTVTGTKQYTIREYLPALRSHQDVVYEYLDIDAGELENERWAIIEKCRSASPPTPSPNE